jgi:sugar phosphate isomerase/epimerase
MRLGISSYTYGWAVGTEHHRPPNPVGALDLIRKARTLGVSVVQLCDNLPAETWDTKSVESIAQEAERAGISIELGTRGTAPDHLRHFCEIGRRLGSAILRVVIDTPDDHPDEAEVKRRLREALSKDISIAIENHDRFPAETLASLVREFPKGRVGICLDTANSLGVPESLETVVESLGPYVINLHLKDFAVSRLPHTQGFTVDGRPLGAGKLDVRWLLRQLKDLGRDPNAILELWTPPEALMGDTLSKETRWAKQSVAAARQWISD